MSTSTNSTVIGKSYASRSNAVRASKKAYGEAWGRTVEIVETDGAFVITAVETETVVKFNKRLDIPKALPTPKRPAGSPRQSGAIAELWEHFEELVCQQRLRRVDVLDSLVEEGYNYWTVRTQLQLFTKLLKEQTTNEEQA